MKYLLSIKGNIPQIRREFYTRNQYATVTTGYGSIEFEGTDEEFSQLYKELELQGTKVIGVFKI